MLLVLAAAAATGLQLPSSLGKADRFTILDESGTDCLELIGTSRVRHESHVPSYDSLERMLAAARTRHTDLTSQCDELERPSKSWQSDELLILKKRKLREKDRITNVLELMRRHPQSGPNAFQLGSGHYGEVLLGRSTRHGRVAIKIAKDQQDTAAQPHLAREALVLSTLQGESGFPALHHYGRQEVLGQPCDVLVMELLGASVEDLCWKHAGGTHFKAPTVLRLGRDVIRNLRKLHLAGFVHNDLKPSNLLLGPPGSATESELHLVDFGISTRADEPVAPSSSRGGSEGTRGTPSFASVAAHEGKRPTRAADDLESLCYCLVFLAMGSLPWQWESAEQAVRMKRNMIADGEEYFEELDRHFGSVATALRALWAEVVRANAEGGDVDYSVCEEALGTAGGTESPPDWARGAGS